MDVKITAREFVLPRGFKVDFTEDNGVIHFTFSEPVKVPYDDASLKRFVTEFNKQDIAVFIEKDGVDKLIRRMVVDTLPEFVGSGFYNGFFYGELNKGYGGMKLEHPGRKDINDPRAILDMALRGDKNSFRPIMQGKKKAVRPEMFGGSLIGRIYFDARIHLPNDDKQIYYGDISSMIVSSLLYQKPVTLEPNPFVHECYDHLRGYKNYVQISNPTLERVQRVLEHEAELTHFFQQRKVMSRMEAAAAIIKEAQDIASEQSSVSKLYSNLVKRVKEIKEVRGQGVPMPAGVEQTTAYIGSLIAPKLAEADKILKPLMDSGIGGVPMGILEYVIAEHKIEDSSAKSSTGNITLNC